MSDLPKFIESTIASAFAEMRAEYDAASRPSLDDRVVLRAPCAGPIEWVDLHEGLNLHEALDEVTGLITRVVLPYRPDEFDPRLEIGGKRIDVTPGTVLVHWPGAEVAEGDVVAWKLAPRGE